MKYWSDLNMGYVGLKTRSLGQIIEKPCNHSRGHIYSPIFMKLPQNDCLYKSCISSKMGHVGSKTRSLDQIIENLVNNLETIFIALSS